LQEAAVASARQDLANLKQELADKQRAEAEEEDQCRVEQQRLLDEARGQKEREDELAREEARMDVHVEEHGAGLDEFFLFERVESGKQLKHSRVTTDGKDFIISYPSTDSPHTHTVRERCVHALSCGMTAEAAVLPVDVRAAVVGVDTASPTEVLCTKHSPCLVFALDLTAALQCLEHSPPAATAHAAAASAQLWPESLGAV
jgi:hypothetical protein